MVRFQIRFVRKRTGQIVPFRRKKIATAIFKAAKAIGGSDRKEADRIAELVVTLLRQKCRPGSIPTIERIQDLVEEALVQTGHYSTAQAYHLYRHQKTVERKTKTEIGIRDDLKLPLNAIQVLERRYLMRNNRGEIAETPAQLFRRVARHLARVERKFGARGKILRACEEAFYRMMVNFDFLPNSPTLMNAGTDMGQLAACFILPVPDDLAGIFESVKNAALIHQTGGGTGFCFSYLRPKGDVVKSTTGVASGPLSFLSAFDKATEVIKQGGRRRGANMGILHAWHPDIEAFITAKQTPGMLENFNVSVAADDRFMDAINRGSRYDLINPRTHGVVRRVDARKLFRLICQSAWKSAEPGMVFIDRMNRTNPTPKYKIHATNPCAEVPMPDYESCNLGSVNVAKFAALDWSGRSWKTKIDWERLRSVVRLAIRFLDNVVDANVYPLPMIREMTLKHRRLGLGVMGFARMLAMLGIRYDSEQAYHVAEALMKFITQEARQMSHELALQRGSFPGFADSVWAKKYDAMRNATVTGIAPTGSISMIADTSSGIEPLFALSYLKTVRAGQYYYSDRVFEHLLKIRRLYDPKRMERIRRMGSIQGMHELPADLRRVFRVAYDISPESHVRMQTAFQKHTDLAVSKTINLPANASVKEVERVYRLAWKLGCKGITIYRDTSRHTQVLHVGKKVKTRGVGADSGSGDK